MKQIFNWLVWILGIGCFGCVEKPEPQSLVPQVSVLGASDVTRTSAVLSGEIRIQGTGKVEVVCFRYGENVRMDHSVPVDATESKVTAALEELVPNTLYYFCLEAGNGYQKVVSQPDSFRTAPNTVPVLGQMVEWGHTPMSVLLSCNVTDDGGCPLRSTGFAFRPVSGGEEKEMIVKSDEKGEFTARLTGLLPETDYRIRAFAENEVGRFYTEEYQFATEDALVCKEPGMLARLIGDDERYTYSSIRVVAPLNGSDLQLLRDMAGIDRIGAATHGKLEVVDLRDASIVSGGVPYDGEHYACTDTVSVAMFSGLPLLRELRLPHSVQVIEADAFTECPSLIRLLLPDRLEKMEPSASCMALEEIGIADFNPFYRSIDGLLYDKSGNSLIWYPRGKQAENLELSSTLKTIEAYALEGCLARNLVIPSSVEYIGLYAFANSRIETVVLPDRLRRLERGVFQDCAALHEVRLGKAMEYLSEYCFDGSSLTDLYLDCDWLPYATALSFAGVPDVYQNCTLHVPHSLRLQYLNHSLWGRFKRIVSF